MTLPLTPDTLKAAYDYLATTPPFSRWNMPDSEDVKFRVIRDPKVYGYYRRADGKHEIAVSSRTVGYTPTLMETMAHEMTHLHQAIACMETPAQHNAAFVKLAGRVCKFHGYDPKRF